MSRFKDNCYSLISGKIVEGGGGSHHCPQDRQNVGFVLFLERLGKLVDEVYLTSSTFYGNQREVNR